MKAALVCATLAAAFSTAAADTKQCKSTSVVRTTQYNQNAAGSKGFNQFVLYTPTGRDDAVVERSDPITNPGAISGHVHQVFGANGFSPTLSFDSLRQGSQCTTLDGSDGYGLLPDMSSYWHPALYAKTKDGKGYIRIPTSGHKIYYRTAGQDKDHGKNGQVPIEPFEFPKGFRMIAGDMYRRTGYPTNSIISNWMCHRKNGDAIKGNNGGFPKFDTACDNYPGFNGDMIFPHCWNRQEFNISDPMAHVAYPEGDATAGECPASHPVRLPSIFVENEFDQSSVYDQIQPNSYVLSNGDPTGYGWHFDFFNGWAPGAMAKMFETTCQPNFAASDNPVYAQFQNPIMSKDCFAKFKPATFVENIDKVTVLPGCNPISSKPEDVKKYEAAPLGSNQCVPAAAIIKGAAGSAPSPTMASNNTMPDTTMAPALPSTLSTATRSKGGILWITDVVFETVTLTR